MLSAIVWVVRFSESGLCVYCRIGDRCYFTGMSTGSGSTLLFGEDECQNRCEAVTRNRLLPNLNSKPAGPKPASKPAPTLSFSKLPQNLPSPNTYATHPGSVGMCSWSAQGILMYMSQKLTECPRLRCEVFKQWPPLRQPQPNIPVPTPFL